MVVNLKTTMEVTMKGNIWTDKFIDDYRRAGKRIVHRIMNVVEKSSKNMYLSLKKSPGPSVAVIGSLTRTPITYKGRVDVEGVVFYDTDKVPRALWLEIGWTTSSGSRAPKGYPKGYGFMEHGAVMGNAAAPGIVKDELSRVNKLSV